MADFLTAWNLTSHAEGGYVNKSIDKGKETWRGIARFFWPTWKGWINVDRAKVKLGLTNTLDVERSVIIPLENILMADLELNKLVNTFYKSNFWDIIGLDTEQSQQIANKVFDISVNMGISTAKEFYKEAKA